MYLLRASSFPLSINNPDCRHFPPFPNKSSLIINSPISRISSRTSFLSKAKPIFCSPSSMPVQISQENCDEQLQECLLYSRAYWVSEFVIAWDIDDSEDCSFYLYASRTAGLIVAGDGIEGHDAEIKLEEDDKGLPVNVIEKFPHIRDYKAFRVPPGFDVKSLLKCQLAIACLNSDKKCRTATGLQLPGVLDELFSYYGPLGAVFSESSVSLYLWAPTAQAVYACIYKEPLTGDPLEIIQLEGDNGVWMTKGPKSWEGFYYVYEVSVYHPSTLQVEKCYANDPYARGLSSNAKRTLLVNLGSDSLKPKGWENLADEKPYFLSFSDISIYELHVRDFSASDETVPAHFRGCYLALTSQDSAGVQHLKRLANAGITHIHLLPTFQFAGVEDEKNNWKSLDTVILEKLPPDSIEQQVLVSAIKEEDAYNWGYNPVLWGVPKGSYSSNPNGPYRTLEFRQMVQALNCIGLRVVLDVVYNHLHGSGPVDENSVLDKIVPGYYLRRNKDGNIEHSTCVNNTASEHLMVERLIIDDLLSWAVEYKVDGFRFDLMGHIMKRTMVKAKTALHSLTKEKDGVDGTSIFIYGEGWDFGEVANNGRGINASQFNLSGTGIGSFNDRIRDAILGGSPFGHPLQQGFATGLSLQINEHDHGPQDVVEHMLAASTDHIQVGMAANLKDYVLTNCEGKEVEPYHYEYLCASVKWWCHRDLIYKIHNSLADIYWSIQGGKILLPQEVKGSEISTYGGVPVAYALCPTETINYVSAHDNETLFDIVSLKTSREVSLRDKCRINHLATSIIALSQGIPFFHAGDELLRSKSLDRDSYNSGDWFNRLDFSYNSNNWGVGLPPKEKNEANWPLIKPRLADPSFKPQRSQILTALENFTNLLKIRYSSPLFRLQTANAIQGRVRFHNTGSSLVPGVIVMSIEDGHEGVPGLTQLDPMYSYIVVIINVRPTAVSFTSYALRSRILQLHPVQLMSTDEIVKTSSYEASSGCFTVPPKTTSVFVEPRP